MNQLDFFRESIKNIKTVGTITRSSKFVCKGMVKHVDFDKADVIIELGAGDGVITEYILSQMTRDTQRLLSFEVNNKFCNHIRKKYKDKRLEVIEDTAENLGVHLQKRNLGKVKYIVSAIPFVSLPKELGYKIVEECKAHMEDGGLFIQIHYTLMIKKLYQDVFGNVDINFVPINIPPAFVLVSEKR